jgi:hypothetical protein
MMYGRGGWGAASRRRFAKAAFTRNDNLREVMPPRDEERPDDDEQA